MSNAFTRIFSDLHYGDRASSLKSLAALRPLLEEPSALLLNGDTLDTRPSTTPDQTAALRHEVLTFFAQLSQPVTFLTGNHDPDLSAVSFVELAQRQVLVTHGDILFEDMVPWGCDAPMLRQRIAEELNRLPSDEREAFEPRLRAYRRAASTIPQRHQSEKDPLKYLIGFLSDTIWPPTRVLHVLRAWREATERAAATVKKHHLPAKFFVMGHTHRLGVTRAASGLVVINTGSFCPPSGAGVVDVSAEKICLRELSRIRGEFRIGRTWAEIALADG